jgi:hypothetical protein
MQKLPWRRKAKSGDRFGLLSFWQLIPRPSETHRESLMAGVPAALMG